METKASSLHDEKDRPSSPEHSDDSPTRLENGKMEGVFLSEDEALARARANPDSKEPIYITWGTDDPSNPRNFVAWKKWCVEVEPSLTFWQLPVQSGHGGAATNWPGLG